MKMDRKKSSKKHVDPAFSNLIQFVPERMCVGVRIEQPDKTDSNERLCGRAIKDFYKSLVDGDGERNSDFKPICTTSISGRDSKRKCSSPPMKPLKKKYALSGQSATQTDCFGRSKSVAFASKGDKEFSSQNHKINKKSLIKPQDKSESVKTFRQERKYFKLLHSAQTGDSKDLELQLQSGLDINHQDFFGYTSLMCAAAAGHLRAVQICLQHGADILKRDKCGQLASDLARMAGFEDVALEIENYQEVSSNEVRNSISAADSGGTYFCDKCKQEFSILEKGSHISSTVHLFHSGHKSPPPFFQIPETNRGFQMLLRTGWPGDTGLGSQGQGQRYPVRTILKTDRKGLGSGNSEKAKVTHFSARDNSAIKSQPGTLSQSRRMSVAKIGKMVAKAREKREKRIERDLRRDLS